MQYISSYDSLLGGITLASDGNALTGLWFDGQKFFASTLDDRHETANLPVFEETRRWLDLYFSGAVPDFRPALSPSGSPFRKTVWNALLDIPWGGNMTYGQLAARVAAELGVERMSAQAVGGAVGHNPISLIIPCHRVMGADGRPLGYAGGIERKLWLLRHENIFCFNNF